MKKNLLFDLFWSFAKIGLFTFGGGYAMIPLIEEVCVENKGWITSDELSTVTAIAESTPGPIAINCATFTGYAQGGFAGALSATFGMVLPSFIIIYIISVFFDDFLSIAIIANAFKGIKIGVGILILQAGINMYKKMKPGNISLFIFIAALAAMLAVDILAASFSTIYFLVIAAVFSIAVYEIKRRVSDGGAEK